MSAKFEKIYLHVGLGKTGSTAIQHMLLHEASELEEIAGIHIPREFTDPRPFGGNHSIFLRSLFAQQPENLRFNVVAGLGTQEKVFDADRKLQQQYLDSFESSPASRLLLSAEGVGHFDADTLQRLADWLAAMSDNIEIIACVRHPRHALAAEIQQRLKTGARLDRLYERPPFYRYSEIFSRLENCFGKESLKLYDYCEACPPRGSAASAFLARLGVQLPDFVDEKQPVNVGISHEATHLLDALNRLRPLLIEGEVNPLRKPGDLSVFLAIPGKRYRPPESVLALLDKLSQGELDWLDSNYGLRLNAMDSAARSEYSEENFVTPSVDEMALSISDQFNSRQP